MLAHRRGYRKAMCGALVIGWYKRTGDANHART